MRRTGEARRRATLATALFILATASAGAAQAALSDSLCGAMSAVSLPAYPKWDKAA